MANEALIDRGEAMMEFMLGDRHEAYDAQIEAQYGKEYLDRLHESYGSMGSMMWQGGAGYAPSYGMMGMMGGYGYGGWGIGWFTMLLVWAVGIAALAALIKYLMSPKKK